MITALLAILMLPGSSDSDSNEPTPVPCPYVVKTTNMDSEERAEMLAFIEPELARLTTTPYYTPERVDVAAEGAVRVTIKAARRGSKYMVWVGGTPYGKRRRREIPGDIAFGFGLQCQYVATHAQRELLEEYREEARQLKELMDEMIRQGKDATSLQLRVAELELKISELEQQLVTERHQSKEALRIQAQSFIHRDAERTKKAETGSILMGSLGIGIVAGGIIVAAGGFSEQAKWLEQRVDGEYRLNTEQKAELERRAQTGRMIGYSGIGIIGGGALLVLVGTVMSVTMDRRREEQGSDYRRALSVAPAVLPAGAGLTMSISF